MILVGYYVFLYVFLGMSMHLSVYSCTSIHICFDAVTIMLALTTDADIEKCSKEGCLYQAAFIWLGIILLGIILLLVIYIQVRFLARLTYA